MKSKLVYTLLVGTFLTSSAVAETIEVTADYLNSLTSPNIAWDESNKSDYSSVLIGGNEFFFGYTGDEDKAAIGLGYEGSGWLTGGAFYNDANMGDLVADFVENYLSSSNSDALGGAIYNNYGNINDIIGNFVANYAEGNYAYGGALYNYMGVIDDITGSYIGNYVQGSNYAYGGAIYNYGISNIDDITGSFIGNSAVADYAYGGAVFNDYNGLIGVITGDFINNYVQGGDAYGGAIYNRSYMGDINGNFENNYAEGDYAYGGALYNEYGNIDDITGNFSYNSAYGSDYGYGGAIYNNSNIDDITGNFTGNYAEGYNTSGGAVYNNGEIPLIAGGFYDNATYGDYANGGAIFNSNYLGDINGDFSNNYSQSEYESVGGAIFNTGGNINDIIGNFSGNYSKSNGFAGGGALFNNMGVIDDIEGDFTNNYAQGYDAEGGAIFNYGINIDDVTGNFSNNYAKGDAYAYGGAIYSNSLLGDLNGDFSKNHASADEAFGGAIYNTNYIGDINGNFEGNYAKGEYTLGGAIFNVDYGNIDDINGDFIGNYAKSYGDYAAGGAIYNDGGTIDDIIGSFVGNYAQAEGYAFGGAIYNDGGDLTFATEGEDYKISGNYTKDSRGKINNAIWMQNSVYHGPELPANIEPNSINISLLNNNYYDPLIPSLNFKVTKNGSYTIDDQIDGGYYYGMQEYNSEPSEPVERYGYGYNLNISGDACPQCEWNSVRFNDLVNNVNNLTISKSQMALGKDAVVNVVNNYIAISNPYLRLDLDAVNKKVGQLNIGGNIEGTTSVIVNVLQHEDIAEENSIVFATAQNHSLSEEEAQKSFEIYRVVGSPYVWAVSYNDINKTWGLYSTSDVNNYTEDCTEPETPDDSEESETPEVFDGFMPTLDRIKSGVQVVDYISDVEDLPNSAFGYAEASSGDNGFSFTDTNAYGVETDKAYKIVLKPEEFSTSSDLTFTADNNGPIEVQLPNGETQYFSYEYTGDESDAFVGIHYQDSNFAEGGAIYDITELDSNLINADFVENYVSSDDTAVGGAIYNDDNIIDDINGDFVGNYAESGGSAYGGAITNGWNTDNSEIGDIIGNFIGNYASGYWDADGGAILNDGTMGNITGDFIGNYAEAIAYDNGNWVAGGAIENWNIIGNITGDFISNHVKGDYAYGGAISNDWGYKIGNITGDFIGNYAEGRFIALGGAMFAMGNSEDYETGTITGSFINNYVKVTDESGIALGGAIFVEEGELTFKADGITNRFSGNYIENADGSKVNNAIWVNNYNGNSTSALNFEVKNGGAIVFDDEIDGGFYDWNDEAPIKDGYGYNVNIYGDVCPQCIVNSVIFNTKVKNVYDLTLDTTQMVLGKNAHVEIVNDYIAQNNPYLRLNVDAVNGKTGQLEIGGQVIGTTQVIANIVNYKDVRGEESIVFATAVNDTTGSAESFKIFRTVGSPYKWYVDYDETAKTWGLAMGENINDYEEDCYPNQEPSPKPLGPIQVEPEVIAMEALPSAGLAQTNGMIYNIMRKVGNSYIYCPGCGFYDPNWDGEPFHNVWVDTAYNGLTIGAPVEIDAKVWGIEAGADIQKDLNNKLGIFVSYRQGNYEMDGKGDKYFSKLGSELDIDSYLAGLYYRYDNNNWYAFATLYGGMQNAEIQTDDGVSTDTDGIEFGGSAEVGYNYALNKTVFVTPTLGVFYSQINYDDASDNYGKTVEYDDLRQVELEAGLKLSKAVYTDNGTASVYVKPSVVQTLVDGDEINITEIGKVDTIEDKTLGRIEIGGSYGFNNNWSAYGWANYTFGSDYEATSLGAGLNYAW